MSVRRLDPQQPEHFEFSSENLAWAEDTIKKYPEGKQASAVIPLLWRAQEQNEGWVSEPAIRYVADMLGMAYIRVYEIATFYTMFQLSPVGKIAHIQVCGTTPCMLRGSEDLKTVCKNKISENPHELSEDGNFSWEEVECLGVCVNAPMVQIWKDTYEDLTVESFEALLEGLADGNPPEPGSQNGRHFSCPQGGVTTLQEFTKPINVAEQSSGNVAEEMAYLTGSDSVGIDGVQPTSLDAARNGEADDLKKISGVGPKLEETLNGLGIYHFDQIASWSSEHVTWIDAHLNFKGRVEREGWIEQAKTLAEGADTEFSSRYNDKSGEVT